MLGRIVCDKTPSVMKKLLHILRGVCTKYLGEMAHELGTQRVLTCIEFVKAMSPHLEHASDFLAFMRTFHPMNLAIPPKKVSSWLFSLKHKPCKPLDVVPPKITCFLMFSWFFPYFVCLKDQHFTLIHKLKQGSFLGCLTYISLDGSIPKQWPGMYKTPVNIYNGMFLPYQLVIAGFLPSTVAPVFVWWLLLSPPEFLLSPGRMGTDLHQQKGPSCIVEARRPWLRLPADQKNWKLFCTCWNIISLLPRKLTTVPWKVNGLEDACPIEIVPFEWTC